MRIRSIFIVFSTLFFMQIASAGMFSDGLSNKQCSKIADACKSAGFTSQGMDGKSFWFGCMKPLLYGKNVDGIKLDMKDIQACRKAKIAKMQKEVNELKAIK